MGSGQKLIIRNACVSLGSYPKWLGRLLAWFISRHSDRKEVKIVLYGRGKGSRGKKRYSFGALAWRKCPRVAIYAYFYSKDLGYYKKWYSEEREKCWKAEEEVKTLQAQVEGLKWRQKEGVGNVNGV